MVSKHTKINHREMYIKTIMQYIKIQHNKMK